MRGRATAFAVVAMLSAALVGPTPVGAAAVLKAKLSGEQIANPRGGAAHGVGAAALRVDSSRQRVCFEISYHGLGSKATAGYLRRGEPGETARPAVVLFSGARFVSPVSGCVAGVGADTIAGLQRHPGGYYVDVASGKLPKGAVRGQLRAGRDAPEPRDASSGGIG